MLETFFHWRGMLVWEEITLNLEDNFLLNDTALLLCQSKGESLPDIPIVYNDTGLCEVSQITF